MSYLDELPKLLLCPLLDSYSPTLGNDVITTQYESGMPRQRLAGIGRPHETPLEFRHKGIHQEYLLAFWRLNRNKPFAMRLKLDSTSMEWYECRFVGAVQPVPLGGDAYSFSCAIVARPKPLDAVTDQDFTDAYELTGGDLLGFLNPLERLVNVELYGATRSLNA